MNWLDMRTVVFTQIIAIGMAALVIALLWSRNRKRFAGLSLWFLAFVLQGPGMILILLRGRVPDWMSMTLSNALVVGAVIANYAGLCRFVGRPHSQLRNFIVLAVFIGVNYYFSAFLPDLVVRDIAVSAVLLILFVQGAWLMLHEAGPGMRRFTANVGRVYVVFCLAFAVRIGVIAIRPPAGNDFFASGPFEALAMLVFQMLFIMLSFSLVLMVNDRLLGEVKFQEEKFTKAFHSSPYAVILTRASDGRILEVNDGFVKITGYAYAETVGKTTADLRLWDQPEDRTRAVALVAEAGEAHGLEYRFRKKSGEEIFGMWSAERILIDGRPCILSSISDITSLKQTEQALSQSLQEKELLMKELQHRVKNSLTVVSSLLNLSREDEPNPKLGAVVADLRTRILSISSVYEQLDRTGRADTIHLREYILALVESLKKSYGPADGRVRVSSRLEDIALETKRALPVGLILNELIINAFKYAYPDGRAGEIRVELKALPDGGTGLSVSDDGVGLEAGPRPSGSSSTGTKLINLLAEQVGARISHLPGPGTTFTIAFQGRSPGPKPAESARVRSFASRTRP